MMTDGVCEGILRRPGVRGAPLVRCRDPVYNTIHHFALLGLQMLKTVFLPSSGHEKTINLIVLLSILSPALRGDVETSLAGSVGSGERKRRTLNLPSITKQQRNTQTRHLFHIDTKERRYLNDSQKQRDETGDSIYFKLKPVCRLKLVHVRRVYMTHSDELKTCRLKLLQLSSSNCIYIVIWLPFYYNIDLNIL